MRFVRYEDLTEEERKKALEEQRKRLEQAKQAQEAERERVNNDFNKTYDRNQLWNRIQNTARNSANIVDNLALGIKSGVQNFGLSFNRAMTNQFQNDYNSFDNLNKYTDEVLFKAHPELNKEDYINKRNAMKNQLGISGEAYANIRKEEQKPIQEAINNTQQKMYENTQNTSNPFARKLSEIAPSIGQMAPGLIPGVGGLYMAGSATGQYYNDAQARGMNEEDSQLYAGIMGFMESATEMIGLEQLSKAGKGIKSAIKGTSKEASKTFLKSALKDYGIGIADNAIQEAIIDPIQEVTAQTIAGKDKAQWEGIGKKMLNDAIDGALVSAILGGSKLGIDSCTSVITKYKNGQKVTKQEMQKAVKDAGKQIDTNAMVVDSVQREVAKVQPQQVEQPQMINTQEQVTQRTNQESNANRLKEIINNDKYLSNEDKQIFLEATQRMLDQNYLDTKGTTDAINGIKEASKQAMEQKESLDIGKSYLRGRKEIYNQYRNVKDYDTSVVDNALEVVPTNKVGKRTKEQWLQVAKQIGANIADRPNSEIQKIAYKSWQDTTPNTTDTLNRQGKKYVKFDSDEWINTIYNQVEEQRRNIGYKQQNDTITALDSLYNEINQPKQENVLNSNVVANKTIDTSNMNFIDSAKAYNIDTNNESIKSIDTMLKNRGINARFDDKITGNGVWIPRKDGTREVILNPKADTNKTIEFLAVHELTHDLAGTKEFGELRDLILDKNKTRKDYSQARANLEDIYSQVYDKNGENFKTLVDEEEVADTLGQKLGDTEFINNLHQTKPNVFKKVYDWVVDKLNKFTGGKIEKLYWEDVKNKFEKAYRQDYNLKEGTKYSFVGTTTEQANQYNDLKSKNISENEIFKNTGVYKGADNKLRFELNDENSEIIYDNTYLPSNQVFKLSELLKHDKLYEKYPYLKDVKISFQDLGENLDGGTLADGTLVLNNDTFNPKDKSKNKIMEAIEELSEPIGSKRYQEEMKKVVKDLKEQLKNYKSTEYQKELKKVLLHEVQHIIQDHEGFTPGTSPYEISEKYAGKTNRKPLDLYLNTAGEIEAREVEKRISLNDEQRRQNLPFMKDENTVYADKGNKQNSISTKELDILKEKRDTLKERAKKLQEQGDNTWVYVQNEAMRVNDKIEDMQEGRYSVDEKKLKTIKSNTSTGEILTDGEYVYKNSNAKGRKTEEIEIYNMLKNNPNVLDAELVKINGDKKIKTKKSNIISTDDIKPEKRASIGKLLKDKNFNQITNALNELSNNGYAYNDELQLAYDKGNVKLMDFSNSQKRNNEILDIVRENYSQLAKFYKDFGLNGYSEMADTSIDLLDKVKTILKDTDSQEFILADDSNTNKLVKEALEKANGIADVNNIYYVKNARMIEKGADNIIELDYEGNNNYRYILSNKPIDTKIQNEYEITPIYESNNAIDNARYSVDKQNYRGEHQINKSNSTKVTELDLEEVKQRVINKQRYLRNDDYTNLNKIKRMIKNPEKEITIYRASPVNELNDGDWVTIDRDYAKTIAQQNGGKVYKYTIKPSQLNYSNNIDDLPSLGLLSAFQYNESGEKFSQSNQGKWDNFLNEQIGKNKGSKVKDIMLPMKQAKNSNTDVYTMLYDKQKANIPTKKDMQGNGKQRKTYKSILESENTSPEAKAIAKELIGTDTYVPDSNKAQIERADARIERNGVEAESNTLATKIRNNDKINAEDIAVGERLIEYYTKTGEKEKLQDTIQNVALAGTSLGQAVQAMSLISRQTPQGQAVYLQKVVDRMNKNIEKRTNGKGKQFNITPEMLDTILNSNEKNLEANLEKVTKELGQQVPKTILEKIDAWRYFSMLANLRTHIRNVVGNVAMGGLQGVKNKVGAVIEAGAEKVGLIDERTKTIAKASKETKQFAKDDLKNVMSRLQGESKFDARNAIQQYQRTFKSDLLEKTLGKAFDLNTKALDLEDVFGLKQAYKKNLADYMTANKLTPEYLKSGTKEANTKLEKARQYAIKQAQEATFHQESALASWIAQFENKSTANKLITGAILPFKKTPINVAKTGIQYSPVGIVKALTTDLSKLNKGEITANQYIDNVAKGLTGTGIALAGYALAQSGILSASRGDEDDKKKYYAGDRGQQPFAITIGNKTYSLDWLAPTAIPLFLGAEINQNVNAKGSEETQTDVIERIGNVVDAMAKSANPMVEMSMLSGLASTLKGFARDETQFFSNLAINMGKSYVNQFFPTLGGQIARTIDPIERSTTSTKKNQLAKAIDSTQKQIASKIPLASKSLPARTDVWGNQQERAKNPLYRLMQQSIFPWSEKALKSTKVDNEISLLYEKTGEKSVLPNTTINKDFTINSKKYRITSEEYAEYKKSYGKTSYDLLNSLVNSKEYKGMNEKQQEKAISEIYKYANEVNKVNYAEKHNTGSFKTSTTYDTIKLIEDSNGNKEDYFKYLGQTDGIEETKVKTETLKDMDISNNSKEAIYKSTLGKQDKLYNNVLSKSKIDIDQYLDYKTQEFTSDKKDDGTLRGKTITNSKKNKVYDYVNVMDITRKQKILLLGSSYKLKDSEQEELFDYINNIPGQTKEEKIDIFKEYESNFTIYKNGRLSYK